MARKKFTLARLIEPYRRKYIGLGSEEELNNFLNPVATSTDLGDPDAEINTVDKYVGKPAYDTTLGEPVWASGADPGDPWEQATGTGGGGGGTPAGADTEIQYNDAGSFGASANFRFDASTNDLSLAGRISFSDNTDDDTIQAASVGLQTQSFINLAALNFAPGFSGHFLETFVNGSTVVAGAHVDLTNRFPGTKAFLNCNDLSAGTLFTIDADGYIGDYPGTPAVGEVLTWTASGRAEFQAGGGGGGLFSEDGNSNIIGGTGAGASITSGSNNFLGGVNAGNDIDSADRNIIIGNNALPDLDISGPDNIIIGANTVRGVGTATMQRNTIIGGLIWDSGVGTSFDCVVIGNQAMRNFQMGSSLHTVIGAQAGRSISNSAVGSTAIGQIAMGGQTGTPTLAGANNIAIGYRAMSGVNLAAAADNIAIGLDTLNALVSGDDNIAIGSTAGTGITTGSDNILIGNLAGDLITDGDANIAIGDNALGRTTGAGIDGNIAIGRTAGRVITSGEDNIFIGRGAGDASTTSLTGDNNVFIGQGAGGGTALAGAANNVAMGLNTGLALRDGSENTILGHNAGVALRDGENNIVIGVNAGPTAAGQDTDSKLYIDITQTDTPLIEGDFVAGSITINGDLNVTGSAPGGGIGGSISDNQVAVGAATSDEIEGSDDLIYVDANRRLEIGTGNTNQSGTLYIGRPTGTTRGLEINHSGASSGADIINFLGNIDYDARSATARHNFIIDGSTIFRIDDDLVTSFVEFTAPSISASNEFNVPPLGSDPGSPTAGGIWQNTTSDEFKVQLNSTTEVLATESWVQDNGGFWSLIETVSPAGETNIDLTFDESLYSAIRIELDGIQPGTDAVTFRAQLGDTNGTVIYNTTNDYDGVQQVWEGSAGYSALAASDRLDLAASASSAANETISGSIELKGFRGTDLGAFVHAQIYYRNSVSNQRIVETKAFLDDNVQAAIDTVRLFFASGVFASTGQIKVYGLRV